MGSGLCVSKSHYLDKIDVLQDGVIIEGTEADPEITLTIPRTSAPKRSQGKGRAPVERKKEEVIKVNPVVVFPENDIKNPHDVDDDMDFHYGQVSAKRVTIKGSWLGNVSGSLQVDSHEFRRNTQIFMTVFEDTEVKFLLEQHDEKRRNRNAKIFIFRMENNGEVNSDRMFSEDDLFWSSSLSMSSSTVESEILPKFEYPYIIVCSQTRNLEGGYILHIEAKNEVIVKVPRNFCEFFPFPPNKYFLDVDGEWTESTSGGMPKSLKFNRRFFQLESERRLELIKMRAKMKEERVKGKEPKFKLDLSKVSSGSGVPKITHTSEEVIDFEESYNPNDDEDSSDDEGGLDRSRDTWLANPQIPLISKEFARCFVTLERTSCNPLTMGLVVLKPIPQNEGEDTNPALNLEDNYDEDDEYDYSSEDDSEEDVLETTGKSRKGRGKYGDDDSGDDRDGVSLRVGSDENQFYKKSEISPFDVVAQCSALTCQKSLSFRCFLLPSDQPYVFVPFLDEGGKSGKFRLRIRSNQPIHRQHYNKVEKWNWQEGLWMERTCGGRPDNHETNFFNCPQFFLRIKMSEDSPWINREESKSIPAQLSIEQVVHGQDHMCIGFFMLQGGYRFTKKNWDHKKVVVDRFPQYKQVLTYNLRLLEGESYTIIPFPMLSNYTIDYKIRVGIKTHLPSDTDVHFVPAPENKNLFIDMDEFEVKTQKGNWDLMTSGGDDLGTDPLCFNNPQFFISAGSKTKINVKLAIREPMPQMSIVTKKSVTRRLKAGSGKRSSSKSLISRGEIREVEVVEKELPKFEPFPMGVFIIRVYHDIAESRIGYLENVDYDHEKEEFIQYVVDEDDAESPIRKNDELFDQISFSESICQQTVAYQKKLTDLSSSSASPASQSTTTAPSQSTTDRSVENDSGKERRGRTQSSNRTPSITTTPPTSFPAKQSSSQKKTTTTSLGSDYNTEVTKNVVLPSGDYIFLVATPVCGISKKFHLTLRSHKKLRRFTPLPSRAKYRIRVRGGFIGGRNLLNPELGNFEEFIARNSSYRVLIEKQDLDPSRKMHLSMNLKFSTHPTVMSRIIVLREKRGQYEIVNSTKPAQKRSYVLMSTLDPGEYRIVVGIEKETEGQFEIKMTSTVCAPTQACPIEIESKDLKNFICEPDPETLSGRRDYFGVDSLAHKYSLNFEFKGIVGPLRSYGKMKFLNPHFVIEPLGTSSPKKNSQEGSGSKSSKKKKLKMMLKITRNSKQVSQIGIRILKTKSVHQKGKDADDDKVLKDLCLQNFDKNGEITRRICITELTEKNSNEKLILEFYPSRVGECGSFTFSLLTSVDVSISKVGAEQKSCCIKSSWYSRFPKSPNPLSVSFIHNPMVKMTVRKTEEDEKNGCDYCCVCVDLFSSILHKEIICETANPVTSSSQITSERKRQRRESQRKPVLESLNTESKRKNLDGFFPSVFSKVDSSKKRSIFSAPKTAVIILRPSDEDVETRIKNGLKDEDFLGDGLKTIVTPYRYSTYLNIPFSEKPYTLVMVGIGVNLRVPLVCEVHHRGGDVKLESLKPELVNLPVIGKFEKIISDHGKWSIHCSGDPFNYSESNPNKHNWINVEYFRLENPEFPQWVRLEVRDMDRPLQSFVVCRGRLAGDGSKKRTKWSRNLLENDIIACMKFSKSKVLVKTVLIPEGVCYLIPLVKDHSLGDFTVTIRSERRICIQNMRSFESRGRRKSRRKKFLKKQEEEEGMEEIERLKELEKRKIRGQGIPLERNDRRGKTITFQSGWCFGRAGGRPEDREDREHFIENPYLGLWSDKEQELTLMVDSKYTPFMKIYLVELDDRASKAERRRGDEDINIWKKGQLDLARVVKEKRGMVKELIVTSNGICKLHLRENKCYWVVFSVVPKGKDGMFYGTLFGLSGDKFGLTCLRRVLVIKPGEKDQFFSVLLKGIWDKASNSGVRGNLGDWKQNNPSILFSTDKKKPTLFEITISHNCKYFQTVSFVLLEKKTGEIMYMPPFHPYQTKCHYRFIVEGPGGYELIPLLETEVPSSVGDEDLSSMKREKYVIKSVKRRKDEYRGMFPYFVSIQTTEEVYIESDMTNVENKGINIKPPFEYIDDEIWAILNNVHLLATSGNAVLSNLTMSTSSMDLLLKTVKDEDEEEEEVNDLMLSSRNPLTKKLNREHSMTLDDELLVRSRREACAPLIVYGPKVSVLVHGFSSYSKMYEFSDSKGQNELFKSDKLGRDCEFMDIPMPFVAAGEMGKGRVVVVGDEEIFHIDHINKKDNRTFLLNSVDYVIQHMYKNVEGLLHTRRRTGSFDELQKIAQNTQNPLHPSSPRVTTQSLILCYSSDPSRIPFDTLRRSECAVRWLNDFEKDLLNPPKEQTLTVGAVFLVFEENELLRKDKADLIRSQILEKGIGAIILSKCSGKQCEKEGWVYPANYILKDCGIQVSGIGDLQSNATHEHDEIWWLKERKMNEVTQPHRMTRSERHYETMNQDKADYREEISHLAACSSMFMYYCLKHGRPKSPLQIQSASVIEPALMEIPLTDKVMLPHFIELFSIPSALPSKRSGISNFDYMSKFGMILNNNIWQNYDQIKGMDAPIFVDREKSWDYFERISRLKKQETPQRHSFKFLGKRYSLSKQPVWCCTGTSVYARCGESVTLEISNPEQFLRSYDCWVIIGPRTPNLIFSRETALKRYPKLWIRKRVITGKTEISNVFGGLVFLECRKKESRIGSLTLRTFGSLKNLYDATEIEEEEDEGEDEDGLIEDVWEGHVVGGVASPKYIIGRTKDEEWVGKVRTPEDLSSPWIEWEGEKVVFVLPVSLASNVTFPHKILEFWDKCVVSLEKFCGTVFTTKPIITTDVQTLFTDYHSMASGGGMGHLVVTINDYAFWSVVVYHEKTWLILKELAFFLHRSQDYVWKGRMNGLCHISSLYVMEQVLNVKYTQSLRNYNLRIQLLLQFLGMDKKNLVSGVGAGGSEVSWQVKSTKYRRSNQLSTFFELFFVEYFGWDVYTKVFKRIRMGRRLNSGYMRNQEKVGKWIVAFSNAVEKNIADYYDAMGFLVTQSIKTKISNLRKWLHFE